MKIDDGVMIAAADTAKNNPAAPPERLPRDRSAAIKLFVSHISPQLIALAVLLAVIARVAIGHFTWIDAVVAMAAWAYFPINEWLIHVFMLHYRPRKIFGRRNTKRLVLVRWPRTGRLLRCRRPR